MMSPITNPNAWQSVDAPIKNDAASRSATNYVEVAKQFDVEHNPRYVRGHNNDPTDGLETYCNIFVCDVMRAMGVPLPHWNDPATGVETPMGKGKETSANGVCVWLQQHAITFGWMRCDETQARTRASNGYPTVVAWFNSRGIGHVALVLPGTDFTHIAQAGATNFFDDNLKKGFGGISSLRYYSHD